MSVSDLLVPSIPYNTGFYNFAFFICHLFIDGHFRNGHILYDPNVFDDNLLNHIESVCPVQIPWLTTDITKSSSIPWKVNDRTDDILQLIFFDPHHMENDINQFKDHLTIYRVFILTPNVDGINLKTTTNEIEELDRSLGLKSLMVHYDSQNVHWIDDNGNLEEVFNDQHATQGHMNNDRFERLFDRTFGKFEQNYTICVKTFGVFEYEKDAVSLKPTFLHEQFYVANYLNASLGKSNVNMQFFPLDKVFKSLGDSVVVRKEPKYYKELSLEFEKTIETANALDYIQSSDCKKPIKLENLFSYRCKPKPNLILLHFQSLIVPNEKGTMTQSAYPFRSLKLMVIFVYGTDYTRQMNILMIPEAVQITAATIVFFMGSAAFVLSIIRRKLRLRRNGLILTLIETLVAFIGSGNMNMNHKFERYFFAIVLIMGFFMTSLYAGDLLDCIVQILNQKFTKLEQLKGFRTPIYVPGPMYTYKNYIVTSLK